MKKLFRLLVFVIVVTFANSGIVSAEMTKNFYGYQVKDVNIRQLKYEIDSAIEAYKGEDKFTPLKDVDNAYIYTDANSTYFVKLYPSKQNTE